MLSTAAGARIAAIGARPATKQQIRSDAVVADATGLLDLTAWPQGMRVVVRKDKPHPGAQLRITDVDGWRVTAFAINTPAAGGPHRSCACCRLQDPGAAAPPPRALGGPDQALQGHT